MISSRSRLLGRIGERSGLAIGGRLIAPVGPDGRQELTRFTRTEKGFDRDLLGAVSFVPLLPGIVR